MTLRTKLKESKAIGWPDNSHRDWLDLLLLLATSTISSSLDHMRLGLKRNWNEIEPYWFFRLQYLQTYIVLFTTPVSIFSRPDILLRYLTSSTSWLMKTSLKPPCLPNNAQKQCKQIFESAMDKLVIRILYLFFLFYRSESVKPWTLLSEKLGQTSISPLTTTMMTLARVPQGTVEAGQDLQRLSIVSSSS